MPEGPRLNVVHVAVDAHNLARDDRGIGRYARAVLTRALRDERFRWTFVVRDLFPKRAAVAHALGADAVDVTRHVPRDADVVWFPWNGTFLRTDVPSVATVHDAAPFAFPADDPRKRATEQNPFLATARTARRILVQSRFTADEVEQRLGVEPERIVVTPLAVDAVFARARRRTRRAARAAVRPALRAARRRARRAQEHRDADRRVRARVSRRATSRSRSRASRRRCRAGGVVIDAPDDAALAALYRGAALVALPSTYEGFGFPLLEAMACGAPVLAARAGALPEVGGDAAAWVDDAHDAEAWANALRALLDDDDARAALAARGPARAATFSWERCTAQTLAVLSEVAGV